MKQCDITSLNEEEITALTGEKDIHNAMQILMDWGLQVVNVTMGKDGAWLTTKDSGKLIKTTPPKVVVNDTTGAGDATMAGLIYGNLNKLDLEKTARVCASMSAMEIEGPGARVGIPKSVAELEKFMETHEISQKVVDFNSV
jgi:sugar/nucleoside kinase (ribokinase family)